MSYFEPYIDDTGLHMPTYQDMMEHLINGYKQIFGVDIYLGEDSQDYQLLSLYAKAADDLQAIVLDNYNSRNPMWASGVSLDTLLPLCGIRRKAATKSSVILTVTGRHGVTLPAGSIARDISNKRWSTDAAAVFGDDGEATVSAHCTEAGKVTAKANAIRFIDTPTYDWYTVTNKEAASPGSNIETDAEVRERRRKSVAIPSMTTVDGIIGAVYNVDGVVDVSLVENATNVTDARGIPSHSFCVIVNGGDDAEIAKTIFLKKSPGVGTHGTQSVVYRDIYGRDNTIKFSRPQNVTIDVKIKLRRLSGWDTVSMEPNMREAVKNYVEMLGIGESLIVPTIYGTCYQVNIGNVPSFAITSIVANKRGEDGTSDTINVGYDGKILCGTVTIEYEEA